MVPGMPYLDVDATAAATISVMMYTQTVETSTAGSIHSYPIAAVKIWKEVAPNPKRVVTWPQNPPIPARRVRLPSRNAALLRNLEPWRNRIKLPGSERAHV